MGMSWQEVRDDLRRAFGRMPLYPAAVAFLDRLEETRPETIGFGEILEVTKGGLPDALWVATVLTGSRFAVLDAEMAVEDDGKLVPLPEGAYAAAERDGHLVHPVDGRVLYDWQKHVYPRFRTRLPEPAHAPGM